MKMRNVILVTLAAVLLVVAALAGCSTQDTGETGTTGVVTVASKPHAEQFILGEIMAIMLEEKTALEIRRNFGIAGGTSNLHPAMENGEIDMYPEYTGTGWMFVLKEDVINDPDLIYQSVKQKYQEQYNITWLEQFGFNNTYTLALPSTLAEEYKLKTFTDLGEVSENFVFGAEFDFYERDDGFNALAETYNLNFKETKDMDIGLKYQAIDAGEVDVINAFSTDGAIKRFNLTVLEDDKQFFPPYYCAPIVRTETLEAHPEIADVLNELAGIITDDVMTELNYEVDVQNREAADVAHEFLESAGLL
ncbi:MAG: glycine betaine ABC transporter substrate-binding protein [Bacillota bacterium]|nr:glycine betaine ABC transporter substrate-binding protein [Bacillota bacterium]MDW7684169.1 glycine betaine ABC transporter substrate-binding protein [Bacillota bacterium]